MDKLGCHSKSCNGSQLQGSPEDSNAMDLIYKMSKLILFILLDARLDPVQVTFI